MITKETTAEMNRWVRIAKHIIASKNNVLCTQQRRMIYRALLYLYQINNEQKTLLPSKSLNLYLQLPN